MATARESASISGARARADRWAPSSAGWRRADRATLNGVQMTATENISLEVISKLQPRAARRREALILRGSQQMHRGIRRVLKWLLAKLAVMADFLDADCGRARSSRCLARSDGSLTCGR